MDILVNVVNQKLKIATNLKNLVAGSQEFVRFVFNLNGDWDNLTTFAQFTQNGTSYNQYLDSNNSVYLPSEIGVGFCTLMLYGSHGNTIATTNFLTLTIDRNILVSNAQSTEISTSLYTQLVNRVNDLLEYAAEHPSDVAVADLQANAVRYDAQSKTNAQKLQARTNIGAPRQTMVAPLFSNTATYSEETYVIYNDYLYRCKSAVTSPGEWTGNTNWAGPYNLSAMLSGFVNCNHSQGFTNSQQNTARNNIAAASVTALNTLSDTLGGEITELKGQNRIFYCMSDIPRTAIPAIQETISSADFHPDTATTPIKIGDIIIGANGNLGDVINVTYSNGYAYTVTVRGRYGTIFNTLYLSGELGIGGDLSVTGAATFADGVGVGDDASVGGKLTVDGDAQVEGDVIARSDLHTAGEITATGDIKTSGSLSVKDSANHTVQVSTSAENKIALRGTNNAPVSIDNVDTLNASIVSAKMSKIIEDVTQAYNDYCDDVEEITPLEYFLELCTTILNQPSYCPTEQGVVHRVVINYDRDMPDYAVYYANYSITNVKYYDSYRNTYVDGITRLLTVEKVAVYDPESEENDSVDIYKYINNILVEHTQNKYISGDTVFNTEVSVQTPTQNTHAANKGYVDGYAVAKDQGSANAGKFLVVGNNGTVGLLDISNASGVSF